MPLAGPDWTAGKRRRGDPWRRRARRAARGSRGGAQGAKGREQASGVSRVRTSAGDRRGAPGRAGEFEKRVGSGEAQGARARRSPSSGRRRELRRRQRGRVASGATSAARGRRLRQRSLLAPQLEEAPPESATARGCASHSGCLSPSRCYPLPPPGVGPRRRPPTPAVSRTARVGDAVLASCRLLCRLLPLAVVHLTASVSGAWIPEWGLWGR